MAYEITIKLAAVGLVPRREPAPDEAQPEGATLAGFIKQYIAARPGMKPNTLKNYRQTERSLVDYFRIPSPKTECHAGRESRMLPLFPELRPHLEAVFDQAEPGTTYVISKHRIASTNLRTTLERICNRAGLKLWERAFQNMRASRETELTQDHPLHVVVAWLGNSAPIAARHYLQVTDADFDRAVRGGAKSGALAAQNQAQQAAGDPGRLLQETAQAPDNQGLVLGCFNVCNDVQTYLVPPMGVEPLFSD